MTDPNYPKEWVEAVSGWTHMLDALAKVGALRTKVVEQKVDFAQNETLRLFMIALTEHAIVETKVLDKNNDYVRTYYSSESLLAALSRPAVTREAIADALIGLGTGKACERLEAADAILKLIGER